MKLQNLDIGSLDADAQQIVEAVIALADNEDNLEELSRFTNGLFMTLLGTNAFASMKTDIYALDEYVELMLKKARGKTVNEKYLATTRQRLLLGRV